MPEYPFQVGRAYTKNDIYLVCKVPEHKQKGNWNTGYTSYNGDWFIFCNVGVPGRTGHDYENSFIGDDLHWQGKTGSSLSHDSIRSLLKPEGNIYLFYRVEDRDPFTFAGKARAKSFVNTVPVEIVWAFDESSPQRAEVLPEEIYGEDALREGATKTVTVNSYERNPLGRKICIDRFGSTCAVCNFDFKKFYGSIGEGFIHVHHLKQLSDVGEEYTLNPLTDLRPVCPNCHAMLHRRRPPYTIEELSVRIKNQ